MKDKIVLVTAATRGIGKACVMEFARRGATVFMGARNIETGRTECDNLQKMGFDVRFIFNDASQPDSYQTMMNEIAHQCGRLDILVNNFGTSDRTKDKDIMNTRAEDFLHTLEINLRSVFVTTQLALPLMKNGSSIVNISSVGGAVPDITQVGYGSAKAAINHLTKMMALQLGRKGVRCNAVLPGMIGTEAVERNLNDEFRTAFLRHIPLGRIGAPEDIAKTVAFLGSDDAAYITGQTIAVSGGFAIVTPLYGDFMG